MSKLKYKVGDRVKIKSFDWYNENKDEYGYIDCGSRSFFTEMSDLCGKIATIKEICKTNCYRLEEYDFDWTDEMIECKVEEETKPEPKFKVGDKIKLKSKLLNDIFGVIGYESEGYRITNISNGLTYFMSYSIEHDYELVEEEALKQYEVPTGSIKIWDLPSGYIFKDERGNEIHATKIVLEKANTLKIQSNNMETETHRGYCTTEEETTNKSKKAAWFTFEDNDFADKVELALSNRELIQEDGKWFVVKKKKEYPKTYEECCKVLGCKADHFFTDFSCKGCDVEISDYEDKIDDLLQNFRKLRYCRDAYWKLYGEEMGLGKPWKPDWTNQESPKYCIAGVESQVKTSERYIINTILAFPTPEMRDAFYKNFKELIEECKELL